MPAPAYPPAIDPSQFRDTLDEPYAGPAESRPVTPSDADDATCNTLVQSDYAVADVHVAVGAAMSKSYGIDSTAGDTDDFHFAPSHESTTFRYHLHDPYGVITQAKVELYRRFEATPIMTWNLSEDDRTDGIHEIQWNGNLDQTHADFPDGFITAEHSPYKLKLTVGGEVQSPSPESWTFFHVLVGDIRLEMGARGYVPNDAKQRKVYDALGGLPASGGSKEVRLISNLFKTSSAEMTSNAAYTQYRTLWDKGPRLPVFAKLRVRDAADNLVDVPKALGKIRVLWEWQDVAEVTTRHHADAKTFLDNALNFDKSLTKPKGDNCHSERGGKRHATGEGDAVFPTAAGQNPGDATTAGTLPFKVEQCATRKWSVLSTPHTVGALAGKTGIFFQPCRMAGDHYKLKAHVCFDRLENGRPTIDRADDSLDDFSAIHATSGTFQVWREVHLARYRRKKATLGAMTVGTVQDFYEKAELRMEDKTGGVALIANSYDADIKAAANAQSTTVQAAFDSAKNQMDGDIGAWFKTFANFKAALKTANGWTDAQLNAHLAGPGTAYGTANAYHGWLKNRAKTLVATACDNQLAAHDGVNVFQFDGLYNLENETGGISLNGFAPDFPSASRNKVGYVQCASPGSYGGNSNTMEQTVSHEIGHHLFLPHAPAAPGNDPNSHDTAWGNCMMSYNYNQTRRLCGLCILRLRGWDKTGLGNTAASNKRP